MNLSDWRTIDPATVRELYAAGQVRWLDVLGWDMSASWRALEQARTSWGLPGLVAREDDGSVSGWTYFLEQDGLLRVGGVSAQTAQATAALVDGVAQLGQAVGEPVSCFLFDDAPGLGAALAARGFRLTPFEYMRRPLPRGVARTRRAGRAWHADDVGNLAALLRAAYTPAAGRHFAPGHTIEAWRAYARNLVTQGGCGRLLPEVTRIVAQDDGFDAAVVATALSRRTVHLAQIAVHPRRRRRGMAAALVSDAIALAAARGYEAVTLLVARENVAARRVYERLGFVPQASFLAADNAAPND